MGRWYPCCKKPPPCAPFDLEEDEEAPESITVSVSGLSTKTGDLPCSSLNVEVVCDRGDLEKYVMPPGYGSEVCCWYVYEGESDDIHWDDDPFDQDIVARITTTVTVKYCKVSRVRTVTVNFGIGVYVLDENGNIVGGQGCPMQFTETDTDEDAYTPDEVYELAWDLDMGWCWGGLSTCNWTDAKVSLGAA